MSVEGHNYTFLLDTGASLSVLRKNKIPVNSKLIRNNTTINGLGGTINSSEIITLHLKHGSLLFCHQFHVLDYMPCDTDGIIGLDFLRNYNANINLRLSQLTLLINQQNIIIPIHTGNKSNIYLTLEPRSESIHFIKTDTNPSLENDYVVFPKQLSDNIFLAGCLVKSKDGHIPIRILNINEKQIKIPLFKPELEALDNYNICEFNQSQNSVERVKKLLNTLKLNHLKGDERKQIESICAKYSDIFYLDGDSLGTTSIMKQSINLQPGTKPIYVKPYRLPQSLKPEINNQIKKMLEEDIIEPSTSDWNSPILLVPKKSNDNSKKWRLVIDYRKINNVIQDDKFPLPNITDVLDALSGAIYFSHLDLQQSYFQTELEEASRKITSFTTDTGQYQMKRLPMGLKISASSFSRVMSIAMSGLTYEKSLIYMDDVIVFGRSMDLHNKNLIDIFERLRKVNLKVNPTKCDFLKKELLFLGHIVSAEGVRPDPEKIRVLLSYTEPKNADEVRRFVAFCNYYRKFIPAFAEITLPLNKLCKKHERFIWSDECKSAFQYLKHCLVSPPVLQYPDFSADNEFILKTDASGTAIGSVLCNKDNRPVAYASRPLNKHEINYPTIQKELLAIVWSVKYFRPYLYGRKFTIQTDHKPLIYLFGMKDPSSRLLKFRLQLEEYDYNVVYIKGKDNTVADALSRVTISSDELKDLNEKILVMTRAQKRKLEDDRIGINDRDAEIPNITTKNPKPDQLRIAEILRIPSDSIELTFIDGLSLNRFRKNKEIDFESECFAFVSSQLTLFINLDYMSHFTRAEFANKLSNFCNKINIEQLCIIKTYNNEMFIKDLLNEIRSKYKWSGPRINILNNIRKVVDSDEKTIILNDFHLLPTSGHAGVRRMVNNIKNKYYWPGLEKSVREYVKKCKQCQTMKYSRNIKEPMTITTTANSSFEKIFLDIVGPIETDIEGYSYILTLQCELTKFIEAYPLRHKDTVSVARAFIQFILRYGVPRVIATDRGAEFTSKVMEEVCKLLNIKKLHSTAYHHQSIGALENMHKHLAAFLRIQCDGHTETWSQWLQFWCFVYNTTVHSSTTYSPYELVFGKQCNLPSNLKENVDPLYCPDNYALELKYRLQLAHNDAKKHLLDSKLNTKLYYDKSINPISYKNNDLILLKNETAKKLDKLYLGPFTVVEDLGSNVKILVNGKYDIVHKNRTKPFVNSS